MPPIRPAPAAKTREYRAGLPRKQRPTFDRLVALIAAPRTDLTWYHEVGTHVRVLLPQEGTRGTGWFDRLAEALGPDPSVLNKVARFVELYPDPKDLAPLEEEGVNWTRVSLTFVVADRGERHALLDEAVKQGWTIAELRAEVEKRFPSKRRGAGGRPRKEVRPHGAGPALRELGRQTTRWLDYYEGAFAKIAAAEFRELLQSEEGKALRDLLGDVGRALARMEAAHKKARRTVVRLQRLLKRKGGKPRQR